MFVYIGSSALQWPLQCQPVHTFTGCRFQRAGPDHLQRRCTYLVDRSNAIAERYGVHPPITLAFAHPTLEALASWLSGELAAQHISSCGRHKLPLASASDGLLSPPASKHPGQAAATAVAGASCEFPGADGLPGLWRRAAGAGDVAAMLPLRKWDAGKLCCVRCCPTHLCPPRC